MPPDGVPGVGSAQSHAQKAWPGWWHPSPQPPSAPRPSRPPQNLTQLKRLNLDGNSLAAVPALPASLQELKLNDNVLQGLQHSSFRGAGRPLGRGA